MNNICLYVGKRTQAIYINKNKNIINIQNRILMFKLVCKMIKKYYRNIIDYVNNQQYIINWTILFTTSICINQLNLYIQSKKFIEEVDVFFVKTNIF